jgi:hypothetical protein
MEVYSKTFGKTYEHIKNDCVQTSKGLIVAHSLWLKSLQIHPEALEIVPLELENTSKCPSCTPLEVLLVLNIGNASVPSTSYSLQITINKNCCKTFKFLEKDHVCIPLSTTRQTSVTIEAYTQGQKLPLQHFMGNQSQKQLIATNENIVINANAIQDVELLGAALCMQMHRSTYANHVRIGGNEARGRLRCLGPGEILRDRLRFS